MATATATATQCLGRLVRDAPKGVYCLPFEDGAGYFHVPIRCEKIARVGDLCESCLERERRTSEKVAEMTGRSLQGTHPSYLHGRVNGPIPFWSHIYDGSWYRLKIESGCRVSDETMAKARKAVVAAAAGAGPAVDPEPIPTGGRGRGGGRKPKSAATERVQATLEFPKVSEEERAAAAAAAAAATAAAQAPPAPVGVVTSPPPKKRGPKKATATATAAAETTTVELGPPTAIVRCPTPEEVDDVLYIDVRKVSVDNRSLYLDPKKQKLYDLKFNYVGRYDTSSQRIDKTFPDSDAEN
jgi:hypothetical protein